MILAIIGSWLYYWYQDRSERGPNRPSIFYGEQEGWSFQIGAGPVVKAELLNSTIASRWIVILHFWTNKKRFQSFVLMRDSLDAHQYSRLRMILKICDKNP